MVRKPLSCDEPTFHCIRLDYVRVCMEVTTDDKFIHQPPVGNPVYDKGGIWMETSEVPWL